MILHNLKGPPWQRNRTTSSEPASDSVKPVSDSAPPVAAVGDLWELPLCPCPWVPEPFGVAGVPSELCDANSAEVLLQDHRHLFGELAEQG